MILIRPLRNQLKSQSRSGKYQYARFDSGIRTKDKSKSQTASIVRTVGSTISGSSRTYSRTRSQGHVFRLSRESSKLP